MAANGRAVTRPLGAFIVAVLALSARKAEAGAWTLPAGGTEIIANTTYNQAASGFDHHGNATQPVDSRKLLVTLHGEYGWNDWLTLILAPEYAHATLAKPGHKPERANDLGILGGARLRLLNENGVAAMQLTAKSAGAFDTTVSAGGSPGRQIELRFLYGTNFVLLGHDGFFDAEIAQRWIAGSRADEVPIDLTLGLRISKRTRVLVQSFNIVAEGNARPPFGFYRSHKLSLSLVTDMRPGLSVESGAYFSPAGQNALVERGFSSGLWLRF